MYKLSSFWNYTNSSFLAVVLVILAPAESVRAQNLFAQGDFSKIKQKFTSLEAGKAASYSSDKLNLNFSDLSFGSLGVSFTESPRQTRGAVIRQDAVEAADAAEVLLLRGTGLLNGSSIPVAGAVYRVSGKQELHINFISPGTNTPQEIVQNLDDGSGPVLRSAPAEVMQGKKCGTETLPKITAQLNAPSTKSVQSSAVNGSASFKTIDVATVADFDYFAKYGSASNSRIAAIINATQVIYERDLGLHFNIVRQQVISTASQPYTGTDSGVLLEQLDAQVAADGGLHGADLVHLFTGKSMDESVVGLAWIGVLCVAPDYSTSLTQDLDPALDFIIFAHEVGHNLGAEHDESAPPSVMYPAVGDTQTNFSAFSIGQISAHVNSAGGACFASGDFTPAPPVPTPDPRIGDGDDDYGDGDGGSEEEPYLDFAASFSPKTGKVDIEILRNYFWEGQCTFRVKLAEKANMKGAVKVQINSESEYIHFLTKTAKRVTDTKAKVYVQGEVTNCEGGESMTTEVLTIKPSSARSTKKSDKLTVKNWNKATIKTMKAQDW